MRLRLGWPNLTWTHAATGVLLGTVVASLLVLPERLLDAGAGSPTAPIALPATTAPATVEALPVVVHRTPPRGNPAAVHVNVPVTAAAAPLAAVAAGAPAPVQVAAVHHGAPAAPRVAPRVAHHTTAISRAATGHRPAAHTAHTAPTAATVPAPAAAAPVPAPTSAPAPIGAPIAPAATPAAVSPAAPAPAPIVAAAPVLPADDDHGRARGKDGDNGNGHRGGHDRGHDG